MASKITNKETITNKVTTGTKGGPRRKNIHWQLQSYTKMVPEPKVSAYKNRWTWKFTGTINNQRYLKLENQ